jgi:hypothetical protein
MKRASSTGDVRAKVHSKTTTCPCHAKHTHHVMAQIAKEAANVMLSSSAIMCSHETAQTIGATIAAVASSVSLCSMISSLDNEEE